MTMNLLGWTWCHIYASNDMGHPLFNNIRAGDWLLEYIANRYHHEHHHALTYNTMTIITTYSHNTPYSKSFLHHRSAMAIRTSSPTSSSSSSSRIISTIASSPSPPSSPHRYRHHHHHSTILYLLDRAQAFHMQQSASTAIPHQEFYCCRHKPATIFDTQIFLHLHHQTLFGCQKTGHRTDV